MEDYDAEDRYIASLILGIAIGVAVLLFMVMSTFKTIGEWW